MFFTSIYAHAQNSLREREQIPLKNYPRHEDDRSSLKVGLIVPELLALNPASLGILQQSFIQVLAYPCYWKIVFPNAQTKSSSVELKPAILLYL